MPALAGAQGVRSASSSVTGAGATAEGQRQPGPSAAQDALRLSRLQSFYPIVEGLDSGAGLTGGVGLRRSLGSTRFLDLHYATSLRGYVGAGINLVVPDLADGRASLTLGAQYREAPQMSFFGVGINGPGAQRTSFELRRLRVGADVMFRPSGGAFVDATTAVVLFGSEDGDGAYPSTELVYAAAQAPGLRTSPTFIHSAVGAGFDSRTTHGSATHGGYYRVSLGRWQALGGQPFSFSQADAEATQHISILRDDSVLTLRGLATVTGPSEGHVVPHFLLPSLGGSSTLRGYNNFRFQDRHRVFVSAEYRVMPVDSLEMAVFVDAGSVASRLGALGLDEFRTSVGIGTRVRGPRSSSFGFSVARSPEGFRYYFSFSPKF